MQIHLHLDINSISIYNSKTGNIAKMTSNKIFFKWWKKLWYICAMEYYTAISGLKKKEKRKLLSVFYK